MASENVKKRFGLTIKNWRARSGISQEELAWRAGLHRSYVADIERGARNPSLESIEKLARALEISLVLGPGIEITAESRIGEIVLVEDNPADVELTMEAFKRSRLANPVRVIGDGATALDYLFDAGANAMRHIEQRPHLVLLDIHLPRIGGLEILRRLKNDPRTRTIPVVMLTVSQQSRDIREAQRLGAESFIVKPVDFQNLSQITPQLSLDWALLRFAHSATL